MNTVNLEKGKKTGGFMQIYVEHYNSDNTSPPVTNQATICICACVIFDFKMH